MLPKTLVLTGYGINCEREMASAVRHAGSDAEIMHVKRLLQQPALLQDYQLLFFPGGFSFGDDLGAGKAFANKLTHSSAQVDQSLKGVLLEHIQRGGLVLGVCNGFQLLLQLGLLGVVEGESTALCSLAHNDSNRFENRWVWHHVPDSRSLFTRNMPTSYLPIRHGEGRLTCHSPAACQKLFEHGLVALQYSTPDGSPSQDFPTNPNGSDRAIAGLCDPSGQILGLMAHPEAATHLWQTPAWMRQQHSGPKGPGHALFVNAVEAAKSLSLQHCAKDS
jgi:phosphoribosylformylglycinamidine synthase